MKSNFFNAALAGAALLLVSANSQAAAEWHELSFEVVHGDQYNQWGNQAESTFGTPVTGSDGESELTTFTVEYSNGWKYGNVYLYVDTFFDHDKPLDQDEIAFFTQGYSFHSLNKMFGTDTFQIGDGTFVKDLRLAVGWQFFNLDDYQAGSATAPACAAATFGAGKCVYEAHDVIDLFYGVDIELGNFGLDAIQFHGLTLGIYDDQNSETDFENQFTATWYARANWYLGDTRWQYDGYIQYYADRESSKGVPYESNIYSQHQIKLDLGLLAFSRPGTLFVGTEIQWTKNSFGVDDVPGVSTSTDEFFPALLVEWVF